MGMLSYKYLKIIVNKFLFAWKIHSDYTSRVIFLFCTMPEAKERSEAPESPEGRIDSIEAN